ncbi:MAG: 4Fe-4S ferredoxin [Gammaproteobacteria bacterium]|jgi:adenylylsulfate reductase subunit B|nr:4Fe-4S ferredoxin [Gammaproteobacteria bacterium]
MYIKIDLATCDGCKICYNVCPQDVFTWNEETKKPKVSYEEECWFCGICWMDCPERGIDITYPVSIS